MAIKHPAEASPPTLSVEAILANDAVLRVEVRRLAVDAEAAAAPLRKADIQVDVGW